MAMTRNRAARSGTHPREARITESESPTADLPGPDLNEGIEDEISAADSKQISDRGTDERDLDDDPEESRPRRARETGRRKQITEGSSRQQQPHVIDKAAGEYVYKIGPSSTLDVPSFILIIGTEAQITRELRKLHLRWWHATRSQMEKILTLAGVARQKRYIWSLVLSICAENVEHGPRQKPTLPQQLR